MAVTPTGTSALQLEALRNTIAGSSTFQTWVEAETAAAAKASVYIDAFVPVDGEGNRLVDLTSKRPFAIIEDRERTYDHSSGGVCEHYDLISAFVVIFEADVPSGYCIEDAGYWFRNHVDAVLEEMQALTGTYIRIQSIEQEVEMTRNRPGAAGKPGDYFYWGFRVTVG